MNTEEQHIAAALALGCDTCTIEIDGEGQRHHQPECELNNLRAEQERLSWLLAGVSTAVLGYLKEDEEYAGKPIGQIEEAIQLREAFRIACDQVHRLTDAPGQTLNSTMCYFLEQARLPKEKRERQI